MIRISATAPEVHSSPAAWPPDWSQFLPDLINTAVVGLLVGIGLWIMQTRAVRNERREMAERVWRHHRASVLNAASRPIVRTPDLMLWREQVNSVLKVAEPIDVVTLSTALPGNQEVQALAHLVRDRPVLERATEDLRRRLRKAFDAEGDRLNAGQMRTAITAVIAASLLEVSPSDLHAMIAAPQREAMERVNAAAATEAEQYVHALVGIEKAYAALGSNPASAPA